MFKPLFFTELPTKKVTYLTLSRIAFAIATAPSLANIQGKGVERSCEREAVGRAGARLARKEGVSSPISFERYLASPA